MNACAVDGKPPLVGFVCCVMSTVEVAAFSGDVTALYKPCVLTGSKDFAVVRVCFCSR